MILSATARLSSLRGFRPANPAHRAPQRHSPILLVEFGSHDGRSWHAVGGGDTFAEAIAFARDSCPTDAIWQLVDWADLYGD